MSEKATALVLPHTHWDREWRYPIWQNRWLLVRFMDELLEILESDGEYGCFLMDGQMVPVLDYLEIKPENRNRIKKQIEAGRLVVGPWYTLPDLYPIDGECLIRNLNKGLRLQAEFGCKSKVAYHAFGWGQTAQFPQFYKQIGFELIIAAKKVSSERAPQSEFIWAAPDGSEVLTTRLGKHFRANGFFTVHIPALYGMPLESGGYRFNWANGGRLVHWADPALAGQDYFRQDREQGYHPECIGPAMREAWSNMDESACADARLIMYGSDFSTPNHHLTQILRDSNDAIDEIEFRMAGPDEYAALLQRKLNKSALRRIEGELRDGPSASCTGNALATRMPLKLLNKQVENRLIRQAEPLWAMLYLLGEEWPKGFMDRAWDYLLKSHPHDSINGVTQDKTVNDTLYRLTQASEIAEVLCLEAADRLAARIDMTAFNAKDQLLLLVNPQSHPFRGVMKVVVDTPQEDCVAQIGFEDPDGTPLTVQPLSREERKSPVNDFDARPWPFYADRHTVLIDTGEIPAGGCKVVKVTAGSTFKREQEWWPAQTVNSGNEISPAPRVLENEFIKIVAEANGTLTLTDKRSGRVISGLLELEDSGDSGDYWVHYKPAENRTVYSGGQTADIWLEENGDLSATLAIRVQLPVPVTVEFSGSKLQGHGCRSENETVVTVTSRVTLTRGAKSLRVRTTVENRAENHRLRLLLPTGIQTDRLDCAGHFNVDCRAARPVHDEMGHSWPEMQTVPMQRFADVSDGTSGFAVLSNSFTEAQLMTDEHRTLALTLFRSVRNRICSEERCTGDFPDQKGGQLLQTMTFEYAVYPHSGDWSAGNVYTEADQLNAGPLCFQISKSSGGILPPSCSLFELNSEGLILSGLKKAEDGESVIVRFFNPLEKDVMGTLTVQSVFGAVYKVNINEERQAEITVTERQIDLLVKAGEIASLELTRRIG